MGIRLVNYGLNLGRLEVFNNPINGHYYIATAGGFSGSTMPQFPVNRWLSVSEAAAIVNWRDLGPTPIPPITNPASGFWTPNTAYSVGQVINGPNGRNYIVVTAGQSGATIPTFPTTRPPNNGNISDSQSPLPQLTWTDLGTGPPSGLAQASITAWSPAKQFAQGTVILYPNNGHYYVASVGGVSGNTAPMFPVTPGSIVTEPPTGGITWEDVGTTAPGGTPSTLPQWSPNTCFATGQVLSYAGNGHFYLARLGGLSGATMPVFLITVRTNGHGLVSDGNILWQDSGTVAPASVAAAGSTDQVINLLTAAPLPQVHSLSYFNIATGFAVSSVRNSTFAWAHPCAATPCSSTIQEIRGSHTAEPILLLTAYLPGLPVDAESPWKPKDLIPGFSFGFSLSAPADSFYLGGSFEIWRNLQLATGLNIAKINSLGPSTLQVQTPSNSPSTIREFGKGVFVGVTFNLNFIAGLFGAHIYSVHIGEKSCIGIKNGNTLISTFALSPSRL